MSPTKYSNRLEKLFSTVESPSPESQGPPAAAAIEKENGRSRPQRAPQPAQIGFAFDQKRVRPLTGDDLEETPGSLKEVIEANGDAVGSILLRSEGAREWGREEKQLVQKVTRRLSQQIHHLRFLEQSQHLQSEVEVPFQRRDGGSWEQYLQESKEDVLGFTYDLNQVRPFKGEPVADGVQSAELDLKVRDHPIGRLVIETEQGIDESTRAWVATIGERLSAHLDGLRLNEQREQALVESELLYELSARLSTSDSLQAVLEVMARPAFAAKAGCAWLFLVEKDALDRPVGLKLVAVCGPAAARQPLILGARFNLAEVPFHALWLEDPEIPLMYPDLSRDSRLGRRAGDFFAREGVISAALLPLSIGHRRVGMALFGWNETHTFSKMEQRLYKTLSGQAAVVMNNIILLEQTGRRAREMETVARVSTAASSTLSPSELLQTVVDLTRENFDLCRAQVYLLDPGTGTLSIGASTRNVARKRSEADRLLHINQRDSLVAQAARRREYVIENNVGANRNDTTHAPLTETRSQMAIPMIAGDDLLGVMDVHSSQANRFADEDVRTYTTLAAQVAVALQNANLYMKQAATLERLRELDHLKSDFLANMSHELRTPLNSILGFTDVIMLGIDGEITEQMQNDLTLIEKNGRHLLGLINDVLDMAKIESGRMRLGIDSFDLRELLGEAIELSSSLAREKGISVELEMPEEPVIILRADRIRIKQVLINLLGNGIKFTESGRVWAQAYRSGDRVRMEVKDTGLGIPKDKLEMIFESFSQVDTSTTRKVGGTGLGLPISRSLVEMHGGRLWAESSGIPGQGSTFIIELPFNVEERIQK